jgi:hypothetical protein
MNIEKYTKKIGVYHILIAVAIIVGLFYMGVIQSFFGAVVANQEVETAQCRISGEVWSPDTLKCQCPSGMGYETNVIRDASGSMYKCAPLTATVTAEKPAAAVAEDTQAKSQNMLIGAGIIAAGIVGAVLLYKRK